MSLAGWLMGNTVGHACYRSNLAEEAKNNWMAKKEKTDNRGFRSELHVFPGLEREIRKYCKIENLTSDSDRFRALFPAWMDLSYRPGMAMFVWLQVACI